ncbi:hypothetical protein V8G54_011692 [Vigna mungo]|uniref:Uncharacterized protein n=1 Tax=Vigna mungo TaxID=3915 RepID=A0AAQ3NQ32_VIGMU
MWIFRVHYHTNWILGLSNVDFPNMTFGPEIGPESGTNGIVGPEIEGIIEPAPEPARPAPNGDGKFGKILVYSRREKAILDLAMSKNPTHHHCMRIDIGTKPTVSEQGKQTRRQHVGQLEKDERYAPQYQLLMIFLNQRLDTYLDYHAANFT